MTEIFKPRLEILSLAQRALWPQLQAAVSLGFVLYGGTAIALRLGHPQSIDFDFFSAQALDREALKTSFPFIALSTVLQDQTNALTILVPVAHTGHHAETETAQVKVSFFGLIGFDRVGEPETTDDGIMQVASIEDLFATKVKVILQRAKAKDYRDIVAMLSAKASLAHALVSARTLHGTNFQPSESLKALTYFNDGDLQTLTESEKRCLVNAASKIDDIPEVMVISRELTKATKKP